jgi:hypothetical protein
MVGCRGCAAVVHPTNGGGLRYGNPAWNRSLRFLVGSLLLGMAIAIGTLPSVGRGEIMRTADFLDTIGVNTHIGSEPYTDMASLARMLAYLGVRNVRQGSPIDDVGLADMQTLGRLGARIALIVNDGGPVDLPGAMATVRKMAPYRNAVEGVNEAAIYGVTYKALKGVDGAVALQKDIYLAVRADTALSGVSVYMFTLGGVDPAAFPSIGDLSPFADYANIHSYPPHGLHPIFVLHAAIAGGRTDAPSRPAVITETGYYTLPMHSSRGGVPERACRPPISWVCCWMKQPLEWPELTSTTWSMTARIRSTTIGRIILGFSLMTGRRRSPRPLLTPCRAPGRRRVGGSDVSYERIPVHRRRRALQSHRQHDGIREKRSHARPRGVG